MAAYTGTVHLLHMGQQLALAECRCCMLATGGIRLRWNLRIAFVKVERQGTNETIIAVFVQRHASLFQAQLDTLDTELVISGKTLNLNIKKCNNKGHSNNSAMPSFFRVLSLILNGSYCPQLPFSAQTLLANGIVTLITSKRQV